MLGFLQNKQTISYFIAPVIPLQILIYGPLMY